MTQRFSLRYFPPRQARAVTARDRQLYEEYMADEDTSYASMGAKYGCSPEYIRDRLDLVKEDRAQRLAKTRAK